ncbi:hypothetical protein [Hymenobacter sp. UYP22]
MNYRDKAVPGADPPNPCWLQEFRPARGPWYYEALAGLTVLTMAVLALL